MSGETVVVIFILSSLKATLRGEKSGKMASIFEAYMVGDIVIYRRWTVLIAILGLMTYRPQARHSW